jgi:hypothetical protein
MRDRLRDAVAPSLRAVRTATGDADLRRLLAAWFAVMAGKWALLVTTLVLAYEAGGAGAVGVLSIARFLTPALIAPFAGLPAARWRPEVVLRTVNALRALSVALVLALVVADLPIELLFVATALEAGVGAFTRPLHMALLPALARSPAQLVAANVSSAGAEGLGTFVGPAAAGLLLVLLGAPAAILAVLALYGLGVWVIARLHVPAVGRSAGDARAVLGQTIAGFQALARYPGPRFVVLDFGLQTFVRGLLTVLVVVASIELLGMGDAGVGGLNAAMGLGGLVGAVAALALAGRTSLTGPFVVALAAWGAPIALVGLMPDPVVALLALAAVGVANALLDVSGVTLLQRTTPNASRVAVFGLFDSVANGGVAIGGVVAPLLVAALGIRDALIVTGLFLPIAAVATWPLLRRVDEGGPAGARRLNLIRNDPLFAPLSLATCEHLASCLRPFRVEPDGYLMRQGDEGDEYVVIDTGSVRVEQDGRLLRTLGAGAGVGEIALLEDVPRTASVRAVGPVEAFALERAAFLEAITGHRAAHEQATASARRTLAGET